MNTNLVNTDFCQIESRIWRISLKMIGGGFNSVGAGPNRTTIRSWKYEQLTGFWEYFEDVPGPSYYRIHLLHDADSAAGNGEFDQALIMVGLFMIQPW